VFIGEVALLRVAVGPLASGGRCGGRGFLKKRRYLEHTWELASFIAILECRFLNAL